MTEEEARKLAEDALKKISGAADGSGGGSPASTPPDPSALLQEGRYDDAMRALRDEQAARLASIAGPLVNAAASNARRELAREIGADEFKEWWPEVEKLAKEHNVDLNALVTVDQLQDALKLAKGRNLEKVLESERAKMRAEFEKSRPADALPPLAGGSGGGTGDAEAQAAFAALDEQQRRAVRGMGFDPLAYAKSAVLLNRYREEDGAVTEVPVMDEDIPFAERGEERTVPPGKF